MAAMSQKKARSGIFEYKEFELSALLALAETIRHRPCSCDDDQRPKSGSLNWAISIKFDDGEEWIFRSPHDDRGLQPATASKVLASEVATMKYLRNHSDVPVPEVFSFCATDQNDIGVPYILMSTAKGTRLGAEPWLDDPKRTLKRSQKHKVMKQLGKISATLSNLRFDHIGSVFLAGEDDYRIGECLSPALFWNSRDEFDEDDIPRGPFTGAGAFYTAQIRGLIAHAKDLPLGHHLFRAPVPMRHEYDTFDEYYTATDWWNDYVTVGSKCDSTANCLDYIRAGLALLELLPSLEQRDVMVKSQGYPLHHPDLSTSNVFVDDDLNVTCVIDWACASTVPKSMALVCPGLPHPRNGMTPDLVAAFAKGFVEGHGFDGQEDLCFNDNAILWRFARLVNLDGLQDYHYFSGILRSITRPTDSGDHPLSTIDRFKDHEEVIRASQYLSEFEETSTRIAQRENEYFSCTEAQRGAVARYLTHVVAELNKSFVADHRVWKTVAMYLSNRDRFRFLVGIDSLPPDRLAGEVSRAEEETGMMKTARKAVDGQSIG